MNPISDTVDHSQDHASSSVTECLGPASPDPVASRNSPHPTDARSFSSSQTPLSEDEVPVAEEVPDDTLVEIDLSDPTVAAAGDDVLAFFQKHLSAEEDRIEILSVYFLETAEEAEAEAVAFGVEARAAEIAEELEEEEVLPKAIPRRRERREGAPVVVTPEIRAKRRRAKLMAKLIIWGTMLLFFLAFIILLSDRAPVLLPKKFSDRLPPALWIWGSIRGTEAESPPPAESAPAPPPSTSPESESYEESETSLRFPQPLTADSFLSSLGSGSRWGEV